MKYETNPDLHDAIMNMSQHAAEHLAKHEHPANYELLTHVDYDVAQTYNADARENVTSR